MVFYIFNMCHLFTPPHPIDHQLKRFGMRTAFPRAVPARETGPNKITVQASIIIVTPRVVCSETILSTFTWFLGARTKVAAGGCWLFGVALGLQWNFNIGPGLSVLTSRFGLMPTS